jgi:hypothetical protein
MTVFLSACGNSSATASTSTAATSKVFALMDVGDSTTVLNSFASQSTVDGLAFRTSWKLLEP